MQEPISVRGRVKQLILEHATVLLHYCGPFFKNQVLVLTFWIGKQNVEKHIEQGIFNKLMLN